MPPIPPRSAYVHVPFCRHRCGYCNFTLIAGRNDLVGQYLEALSSELSALKSPRPVDTLFLGGGTPTHVATADLKRLLQVVRKWFPLKANAEFSIEANPSDITVDKLCTLVDAGVNRLSLGVQSFNLSKLEVLERDHTASTIRHSVDLVQQYFDNFSLDLIFGVPGESLDTWNADLSAAIAISPHHVSTYGLTFEKGTLFWNRQRRGELLPISEKSDRAMFETAIDMLTSAGFEHYEISNFAISGNQCRHNQVYWVGGEYYAAGAGAARFVDGQREINHRSVSTYIKRVLGGGSPVAERERLNDEDAAREQLVFGLRRIEGIDTAEFESLTGCTIESLVGEHLHRHLELGLFEHVRGHLRLTREGIMVSDSIWPDFLSAGLC